MLLVLLLLPQPLQLPPTSTTTTTTTITTTITSSSLIPLHDWGSAKSNSRCTVSSSHTFGMTNLLKSLKLAHPHLSL